MTVDLVTPVLDPDAFRSDFPILSTMLYGDKRLIYLDNAATTHLPRPVIETMFDVYEKQYGNVHRGIHWLSERSTEFYESSRRKVQAFIGARRPCEVVFTSGTTAAINLVARSWGDANARRDDEILLTEMEHAANVVPWQQLARRTGCRLRFVPLADAGVLDLDALQRMLSERTRLVGFCAVSNVLGTVNPVREITAMAHGVGATVLVDAAQSVPRQRTDVAQWNADFVAFSGHKMLGPGGVGVLYGRESLLDAMPPFLGGGGMINGVTADGFESAELPAKFEAGTPPIVQAIGLGAATDYLNRVGMDRIRQHEQRLTRKAHELLQAEPAIALLGPAPECKAGIVSFTVDGIPAHDVAQILDCGGVAVRPGRHCAMPLYDRLNLRAACRASFALYNTPAEMELLAHAVSRTKEVFRWK